MAGKEHEVLAALQTTYWEAAHREICSMILFMNDVLDSGKGIDNCLTMDTSDLDCDGFVQIVKLWRKLDSA